MGRKILLAIVGADGSLLDNVFQKIVNFCSYRWGWHFIPIGTWSGGISIAFYAAAFVDLTWRYPETWVCFPLPFILCAIWVWLLKQAIKGASRSRRSQGMNRNRVTLLPLRLFTLINTITHLVGNEHWSDWFLLVYNLLFCCSCYFLSCDEGPPQRQKQEAPLWGVAEAV
jgi:hypothetical protein